MASANFMKATSGKVGAMKRHLDSEERMTKEHSNADINKSMTEQNYFLGCKDWNEMYFSWKDRLKEADEKHPPTRKKADRKTACFVELPCPWEIVNQGNERAFFEMFEELLKEKFGTENYHGMTIHKDEVHEYKEKDGTVKMSMIHGHALVTPYSHWKDKAGNEHEGVNSKNWETRQMLTDFNREINARTLARFGIELNTHGLQKHKTVEELKREGKALERERHIDEITNHIANLRSEYKEVSEELSLASDNSAKALKRLTAIENDLETVTNDLTHQEARRNELMTDCNKLKADINALDKKLYDKRQSVRRADAIESAAKNAHMPQISTKRNGDVILSGTDEKTVKRAFESLAHEKSIIKREQVISKKEEDARIRIQEAEAEASRKVDSIEEKLASYKLDDFNKYASEELKHIEQIVKQAKGSDVSKSKVSQHKKDIR